MPTKEYQIKKLKERIASLKNSTAMLLVIVSNEICELEEKIKKLEAK